MPISESPCRLRASGDAGKAEGAVDLSGYPGLCHAPGHWGEGIRFARNGEPVEEVARDGDAIRGVAGSIDAMCGRIGVPFADVLDALKYLRSAGTI